MQKLRTAVIASILVPAILVIGVATWAWKEGVTLQYLGSTLMARWHLMQVFEPIMVLIPGGTFWQGDGRALNRTYQHWARGAEIKPFALGKFEMTFQEYDQFVELTGRWSPYDEKRGREGRPVINVSWEDIVAYAKWLSLVTGKTYSLPTESEWEYAARSGGQDERWAGTSEMKELEDYAVYAYSREGNFASPVGSKKPNKLGLYDMTGNVWEWVEDCWHEKYEGAPGNG